MNLTARIYLGSGGTLVLKQSLPWVAKYPQIDAPWDRILQEARFYRTTGAEEGLAALMPRYYGLDERKRIAAFEDLGVGRDYTTLYKGETLDEETAGRLGTWLARLHALPLGEGDRQDLENEAMRTLNHAHIFGLPLAPNNGFPLDEFTQGLQAEADKLKNDRTFVKKVRLLGLEHYLDISGGVLLHGDFFPGSWLHTANGLKVIDTEFCFPGPVEFELGIVQAHFFLANQPDDTLCTLRTAYGHEASIDERLVRAFAGAEVMRRIIGIAQLPLEADLQRKRAQLERARAWVLDEI
jgi:5-methylthioribose kinase